MATKYKGLDYVSGEAVLDMGVALVQASKALDVASELAEKTGDKEALLQAAAGWIRMSELLSPQPDEDEEDDEETEDGPIGFQHITTTSIGETDGRDERSDES